MSFQTGTPASLTALMNDLKAFAIANAGFSDTGSGYTASSYTYFSLTKDSVKFNFSYKDASGGGDLLMNTSTAWAGSGVLTAQTGAHSKNAQTLMSLTPIEYWFFTDGDAVHAVVEFSAGAYAHFSFGILTKYGTYTGGHYVCANSWANASWQNGNNARVFEGYVATSSSYANHVRLSHSGLSFAVMGENSDSAVHFCTNRFWGGGYFDDGSDENNDGELWKHQPNNYNGRSVLIPVEFFITDVPGVANSYNAHIPLGRIANAAIINIASLTPEDLVNTDWMVFPLCMKNPVGPVLASGQVNTGNLGVAYQK